MPKITFIRRAYSPSGGAEKYLLRLAESIHNYGWKTQLVTAAEWPASAWKWGETYHIEGGTPLEFADAFKQLNTSTDLGITFSLERVWAADFYRAGDGVHKAWLKRLAAHSSPISNFIRAKKKKHAEIISLETSLYAPPSTTKIIANSQLVAKEISAIYATEPKRICVIHNGFDAHLPDPATPPTRETLRQNKRKKLGLAESDTALLFVGSGWKRKGAYYAIKAMAHLKKYPVKLIIAGKGSPPRNTSENIHFLGEVDDIPGLLLAADLFILPTLYDPFSNATLEAACYGLPVITSRENGFSEALNKFGGGTILDDPTDPEKIAGAVLSWLDPARQAEARPKLEQLAQHHTQQINLQHTLDFILND